MTPRTSSPQDLIRAGRPYSRIQEFLFRQIPGFSWESLARQTFTPAPEPSPGLAPRCSIKKWFCQTWSWRRAHCRFLDLPVRQAHPPTQPLMSPTTTLLCNRRQSKVRELRACCVKCVFAGSKLSPQSIKSTLCNLLTVVALSVHKYVSISTTASRDCFFLQLVWGDGDRTGAEGKWCVATFHGCSNPWLGNLLPLTTLKNNFYIVRLSINQS